MMNDALTDEPKLPMISAELLWFEAHEFGAPQTAVPLPNGDVVFAHRGVAHAMPVAQWRAFEAFQRAAA